MFPRTVSSMMRDESPVGVRWDSRIHAHFLERMCNEWRDGVPTRPGPKYLLPKIVMADVRSARGGVLAGHGTQRRRTSGMRSSLPDPSVRPSTTNPWRS